MTPYALLNLIIDLCAQSPIVAAYTIRTVDLDVLRLRVHLIDESFIEVFYNHATAKFAFALIVNGQRIYGKDKLKAKARISSNLRRISSRLMPRMAPFR